MTLFWGKPGEKARLTRWDMTGQARIVEILLDFNYPGPSVQDVPQWIEMDAPALAWTASLLIHQLALLQGDQYQEHLPRYEGAKEKQALMNMDKKIIDTNHHNIIMNERVVLVTSDKVWILMLACSLSNTAELDAVRIWHSCRDNAGPCRYWHQGSNCCCCCCCCCGVTDLRVRVTSFLQQQQPDAPQLAEYEGHEGHQLITGDTQGAPDSVQIRELLTFRSVCLLVSFKKRSWSDCYILYHRPNKLSTHFCMFRKNGFFYLLFIYFWEVHIHQF